MKTLDELLAHVEEYSRRTWGLQQFKVVETKLESTWWGGRRRVIIVDAGWERARIALSVRASDGKLVKAIVFAWPKPREELPPITKEQALEIARAESVRAKYPWEGEVRIRHKRAGWQIVTNTNWIGCNAWFLIDDRTGVVLSRSYMSR